MTEVLDGDTLVVLDSDGRRHVVRLVGIDAPELTRPERPAEYLAQEAADFVRELVADAALELRRDPKTRARDAYGRLLRYVELLDGRSVNGELLRHGLAVVLTRYPFSRQRQFEAYERAARRLGLGVWAEEGLAELHWSIARGDREVKLHPMGNRSWTIIYDSQAKLRVREGQLREELRRLLAVLAEARGARDRVRRLEREGYRAIGDRAR